MACVQQTKQINREMLISINSTLPSTKTDKHLFKRLRDLGICVYKPTKRGPRGGTRLHRPVYRLAPSSHRPIKTVCKQLAVNWNNMPFIKCDNIPHQNIKSSLQFACIINQEQNYRFS